MRKIFVLVLLVALIMAYTADSSKADNSSFFEKISAEIIELRSAIRKIAEELDELKSKVAEEFEGMFGGTTSFDQLCTGELNDRKVCFGEATGFIGATSTATWANPTGATIIVDAVEMFPTSKASSTMLYWAATSTNATSTVANYTFPNFGAGSGGEIVKFAGNIGVGAYVISTTTIATGTQTIAHNFALHPATLDLVFDGTRYFATTTPTTTALLAAGERLIFGISAPSRRCGGSEGPAVAERACDSATSSQRTQVRWRVKYHHFTE